MPRPAPTPRQRLADVAIPALVAALVYLPWAVRQALVLGTPFPGQAIGNALSVRPEDIFAWSDPPTLARFLEQGVPWLVTSRIDGLRHDLVDVLLLPGFPASLLGLLALATVVRPSLVLRPLVLVAAIMFAVTSLAFPIATQWGTFLHAAVPVHVLLIVGASTVVDEGMRQLARWRGWDRPTAWLGQAVLVVSAAAVSLTLAGYAAHARSLEREFGDLTRAMPIASVPTGPGSPPVITDHPIWYADTLRSPALALPDEEPASVISLATDFGARYLLLVGDRRGRWPAVLDDAGDPNHGCFTEVPLAIPTGDDLPRPRLWRIDCP